MNVTLEPNPAVKIHQLVLWTSNFQRLPREKLLALALDPNRSVRNINVRLDAICTLRHLLNSNYEKTKNKNLLTNDEVERLYNLLCNEQEFPILINISDISVEKVTHIKGQEDLAHKKVVKKDIEENCALLRAEAALLIIDFGINTSKFVEIKDDFKKTLKEILGNMLSEPDQVFVKERATSKVISTDYPKRFIEALYLIDKESAKPFITSFNIDESAFKPERRFNDAC